MCIALPGTNLMMIHPSYFFLAQTNWSKALFSRTCLSLLRSAHFWSTIHFSASLALDLSVKSFTGHTFLCPGRLKSWCISFWLHQRDGELMDFHQPEPFLVRHWTQWLFASLMTFSPEDFLAPSLRGSIAFWRRWIDGFPSIGTFPGSPLDSMTLCFSHDF
jgi:hypothetical protein